MSDVQGWKALVVEDEADAGFLVAELLEHHGMSVRVARDGQEALDFLKADQPHLVIMDLAMPGLNGWDTLAAIRANPSIASIPVIAMTAYHSASVAQDALDAGFNGYFAKPLDSRTFVDQLRKIVSG